MDATLTNLREDGGDALRPHVLSAAAARFGAALAAVLAACLAAALLCCSLLSPAAFAETDDIDGVPDELQERVEEASAAYEKVFAELTELEETIEDNTARLAEIDELLPVQREKASQAIVALYKLSQEGFSVVNMLFTTGSLEDFLRSVDYVTHVTEKHNAQISATAELSAELAQRQDELDAAYEQIDARREEAQQALDEAVAAREEAIAAAKAKAEAEAKAAEEAAAKEAEEKAAQERAGDGGSDAEDSDSDSDSDSEDYEFTSPGSDGVDGTESLEEFIDEWAPRIDDYLDGSPLEGQGETFARAAWDYGVDPRFSPAISCIESSKGACCFLPHNAWGWGSVSWDSWEEAIDSHVRGLARGYGYTVTMEGAKKYCPPNWAFWYSRVSQEMNKI